VKAGEFIMQQRRLHHQHAQKQQQQQQQPPSAPVIPHVLSRRRYNLPLVYKFAKERGMVLKKGQGSNFTHTVVDGGFVGFGPMHVPDTDGDMWLQLFYAEYALSWSRNERLYMVEWPRPGQPHRLYFDFDMYYPAATQPFDVKLLKPLFAEIQSVMHRLFPSLDVERDMTLIVGSGGWSACRHHIGQDPRERDCRKLGLHLIWRDIYVESAWMRAIRQAVVDRLEQWHMEPMLMPANDWASVVDENIARRPSSRMFGSAKLDFCHCKKQGVQCSHERDRKDAANARVDMGRVYNLEAVVNTRGEHQVDLFNEYQAGKHKLLMAVSLCARPPAHAPCQISINTILGHSDHGGGPVEPLDLTDDKHKAIALYLDHVYGVQPTKIVFNRRKKTFLCDTKCRRCFNNFDKDHGSSTCYFVVSHDCCCSSSPLGGASPLSSAPFPGSSCTSSGRASSAFAQQFDECGGRT
jgi:hypothetical protein